MGELLRRPLREHFRSRVPPAPSARLGAEHLVADFDRPERRLPTIAHGDHRVGMQAVGTGVGAASVGLIVHVKGIADAPPGTRLRADFASTSWKVTPAKSGVCTERTRLLSRASPGRASPCSTPEFLPAPPHTGIRTYVLGICLGEVGLFRGWICLIASCWRCRLSADVPGAPRVFPDDAACLSYLARLRWPDGFVCPECKVGSSGSRPRGGCGCAGAARGARP